MLAIIVGAFGGLGVVVLGKAVDLLHAVFFGLSLGQRLSAVAAIEPWQAAVPAVGGLLLGLTFLMQHKWRPGNPVDPIEANALRGGNMSMRDSLIVAGQTVLSSGVGASVGLEAGYTQLGSGIASWIGRDVPSAPKRLAATRWMRRRRGDRRCIRFTTGRSVLWLLS